MHKLNLLENAEPEQQALIEQAVEDRITPILRNLINFSAASRGVLSAKSKPDNEAPQGAGN